MLLLWLHATFARGCLFTDLYPMINQLNIPAVARCPGEGLPAFIKLRLTRWKHNHSGKRQQHLVIHRNTANRKSCPVIAMLFWRKTLKANGIEDGSPFPVLNNAHDEFLRSEFNSEMHLERMSSPFSFIFPHFAHKLVRKRREKPCHSILSGIRSNMAPTFFSTSSQRVTFISTSVFAS